MGAANAIVSLVNEIVIPYFPVSIIWSNVPAIVPHPSFIPIPWLSDFLLSQNRDKDIAYLGIAGQVSGILLMIVIGRLLDWTKAF